MFKISFRFSDKTYSGLVQKIDQQPVQFVVFGITPSIGNIPDKLVYVSNAKDDQLVYQSFNVNQGKLLRSIGESIFIACHQQKIAVHE